MLVIPEQGHTQDSHYHYHANIIDKMSIFNYQWLNTHLHKLSMTFDLHASLINAFSYYLFHMCTDSLVGLINGSASVALLRPEAKQFSMATLNA